ncbi:MAG: hypothetical protein L0154_29250 [Chloroflexi bacterium]|nr:hypothetical protein [Chloroflexota bacterium]
MKPQALIISNNHHSIAYSTALAAYGFSIDTTRTFEAARVLLRSGLLAHSIIVDIKQHSDEIEDFLRFVRQDLDNTQTFILIIGCDKDFTYAFGADTCLQRPADIDEIIDSLRMRQ